MDDRGWREDAAAAYRAAFLTLSEFHEPFDVRTEYWADELRDALFDLKQAVMADDEEFAKRAMIEARFVADEFRRAFEE